VVVNQTIAVKAASTSGGFMTTMVLFTDPIYLVLAFIGAFVSMGSAYYDYGIKKKEHEVAHTVCLKVLNLELIRAFIIGAILSVSSFLLFIGGGNTLLNHFVDDKLAIELIPSFWFMLTIWLTTLAVPIWEYTTSIPSRIINKILGEKYGV
jgi:hypothetical protein